MTQDSDKWGPFCEHGGGPQPVSGHVQVLMLDGDIDEADASEFEWRHAALGSFFPGYIVRYRQAREAIAMRLAIEEVMG